MEIRGSQILGTEWMVLHFTVQIPQFSHDQETCVCKNIILTDCFLCNPGVYKNLEAQFHYKFRIVFAGYCFTFFNTVDQHNSFSIPKNPTDGIVFFGAWDLASIHCRLLFRLSWVMRINVSSIFTYQRTNHILFFVKRGEMRMCDTHLGQYFHTKFCVENITSTFSWYPYSIRNFRHLRTSIFQNHIVHLFGDFRCGCSFRTYFICVILYGSLPRLNLTSHFLTVEIEIYESP